MAALSIVENRILNRIIGAYRLGDDELVDKLYSQAPESVKEAFDEYKIDYLKGA